jgi:DNA-directed RNA polymerase specialized sigma24 family protein
LLGLSEYCESYLSATAEPSAGSLLERIVQESSLLLRQIVRQNLPGFQHQDWEDAQSEAQLRWISRLAAWRDNAEKPSGEPQAYLRTIGRNACADLMRSRYPARHALRRKLRFLIDEKAAFRFHADSTPPAVALSAWLGKETKEPQRWDECFRGMSHGWQKNPEAFLQELLARIGHPVPFDSLVAALGRHLNLGEAEHSFDPLLHDRSATAQSPDSALERRARLERFWAVLPVLPERQRAALLLTLRDEQGEGVIEWLPALGLTTFEALATTLGMSLPELSAIWPRLPVDDQWLADRFGLTRQQVINLRKSARDKLARHLRPGKEDA